MKQCTFLQMEIMLKCTECKVILKQTGLSDGGSVIKVCQWVECGCVVSEMLWSKASPLDLYFVVVPGQSLSTTGTLHYVQHCITCITFNVALLATLHYVQLCIS